MDCFARAQRAYKMWAEPEVSPDGEVGISVGRGKIEALRQEQQVVLSLIYVENLTHQQVATAMGKQVDEIENILKRAIETLQLACGSTRETAY